MTDLETFLENMRREIRQKTEQFKNLGKPHRFPCPYCTKDVEVEYASDGVSYTLKHKVKGCQTYDKPTKDTKGNLINAFVFHCRPTLRYGALEGIEKDGQVFK